MRFAGKLLASCAAIKRAQPASSSGNYLVVLAGKKTAVYCDMGGAAGAQKMYLRLVARSALHPVCASCMLHNVEAERLPAMLACGVPVHHIIWQHAVHLLRQAYT